MENLPNLPIRLHRQLLLADPSLCDGVFNKSVIFLTDHSLEDGAHGLILNHPTGQTVGDVLSSDEFAELGNIPIHLGGPVDQKHLTFAALWEDQNDELQFTTRINAADAVKRSHQPGALVRAFAGYSAWEPGQLESELKKQAWILTLPTSEILHSHHSDNLWSDLLRQISPYHKILAETPDDIYLN
ncbi:MAG: YqgE/AlgH family protein [Akkermansiaceae bacterium]